MYLKKVAWKVIFLGARHTSVHIHFFWITGRSKRGSRTGMAFGTFVSVHTDTSEHHHGILHWYGSWPAFKHYCTAFIGICGIPFEHLSIWHLLLTSILSTV